MGPAGLLPIMPAIVARFFVDGFVDHLTGLHIDGKLTTEQASAGEY